MNRLSYEGNRNQLANEAVHITKELGDVTFIGAVAVFFHTRGLRSRESRDLDFAVAIEIPDEQLLEKGYKIFEERGKTIKRTPRGFKIDIYSEEVGDIQVKDLIHRANTVPVGKKGINRIKVASLEDLIITKHRARREQDDEDLYDIAKTKFSEIKWSLLQTLVKSDYEFNDIKTTMHALYKIK